MDGSKIVSDTLVEMSGGFVALVYGLLIVIGGLYLGKAIWVTWRR